MLIKKSQISDKTIKNVEDQYNATYLLDVDIVGVLGSYFYAEEAHPEGSNYFKLFERNGQTFIANGIEITETSLSGIVAKNGDVIYSRYRHDFVTSEDGSVSADGGTAYDRFLFEPGYEPEFVKIEIQGSEICMKK